MSSRVKHLVLLGIVFGVSMVTFAFSPLMITKFNKSKGTILASKIEMLLYAYENGEMTGNFFYEEDEIKIPLSGSFKERQVEVSGYDYTKKAIIKFKGEVDEQDFTGLAFVNDELLGPFNLHLWAAFPGHPKNMYYDAGCWEDSEETVEIFAAELKQQILNKDKYQVAEKVAYPLDIYLEDKVLKIKNEEEFVQAFEVIFYPKFVDAIKKSHPLNMCSSYRGIMFGEVGEIWLNYVFESYPFGAELKVTGINPNAWKLRRD